MENPMKTDVKKTAAKKTPKPKKLSQSRPARWQRAVSAGQDALAEAVEAKAAWEEAKDAAEKRIVEEREEAEEKHAAEREALRVKCANSGDLPSEVGKALDALPKLAPWPDIDDTVKEDKAVVEAYSSLEHHVASVNDALQELSDLKDEYQEWMDNMPDSLQSSPVYDKLSEVTNLSIDGDLDEDNFEDAENTFDECENADLPRGFGND